MRKFELFEKVLIKPEGKNEEQTGCIIGFETDDIDGCITAKNADQFGTPKEHSYIVIEGEVKYNYETGLEISLTEYLESDIKKIN